MWVKIWQRSKFRCNIVHFKWIYLKFPHQIFICNLTCHYISHLLFIHFLKFCADKRETGPKRRPSWTDGAITSCQNLVRSTEKLLLGLSCHLFTFHFKKEKKEKRSHLEKTVGLAVEANSWFRGTWDPDDWNSRKLLALKLLAPLNSRKWEGWGGTHVHSNFSLKNFNWMQSGSVLHLMDSSSTLLLLLQNTQKSKKNTPDFYISSFFFLLFQYSSSVQKLVQFTGCGKPFHLFNCIKILVLIKANCTSG